MAGGWKESVHSYSEERFVGNSSIFDFALGDRELRFPIPEDRYLWFLQMMQPHLLQAWTLWRAQITDSVKEEPELIGEMQHLSEKYHDELNYAWGSLWAATGHWQNSPRMRAALDMQDSDSLAMEGSEHAFHAELWMPNVGWNPEILGFAYDIWMRLLLQPKAWDETEQRTNIPFMLEFPEKVEGLPKNMILGGIPFEMRLGRFLVPSDGIRQHPYGMRFFDYIGPEYENMRDRQLNRNVFDFMDLLLDEHELVVPKQLPLLDAGCGTGFYSQYSMRQGRLYGVDFSKRMVEAARLRMRGAMPAYEQVLEADIAKMSGYRDGFFGSVILSYVELWMDRNGFMKSFREINRVLANKGIVIFNIHEPIPGYQEIITDMLTKYCGFSKLGFRDKVIEKENGELVKIVCCVARKWEQ
jgi:SAM-dependent methyltransferase